MMDGERKRLETYLGYGEKKKLAEVINTRIAELNGLPKK
jgi:hypothetical protein